jgi:hypothetical protein
VLGALFLLLLFPFLPPLLPLPLLLLLLPLLLLLHCAASCAVASCSLCKMFNAKRILRRCGCDLLTVPGIVNIGTGALPIFAPVIFKHVCSSEAICSTSSSEPAAAAANLLSTCAAAAVAAAADSALADPVLLLLPCPAAADSAPDQNLGLLTLLISQADFGNPSARMPV